MELVLADHKFTRSEARSHPENLYLFADNGNRSSGKNLINENSTYYKRYSKGRKLYYPSITTACIRGLENALPIITCKRYGELFDDGDYAVFDQKVWYDFSWIAEYILKKHPSKVVIPANKFIDGKISKVNKIRTPRLVKVLEKVNDRLELLVRGF